MSHIELIGFVAAIITSLSYLPQALRIVQTGETAGISLGMYSLLMLGKSCWLTYGILMVSWPLIAAQFITMSLAMIILTLTIKDRLRSRPRHRKGWKRNWSLV